MRMNTAFLSLFILFVVGFLAIGWGLGAPWYIPVGIASLLILVQYLVSPYLVKLIYKIDWVGLEALEPGIRHYIVRVCRANRVELPKYGVIHDDNPNAFCFGWTRNRSFLVLTDGIDKYCTLEEKKAVAGHELGHIIHNDFVIMTIICMVPLLFYIIGRSCMESMKHSSGNNKGAGIVALIGIISLVIYIISEFIVLMVSRYREYWADGFSARSTRDPNSLSSALVKIAYGLASEGKGDSRGKQIKYENALMISDPRSGRSLAFNSGAFTGKSGFSIEDIKEAMAWDMWNPWAKWLELKSSHPLPAKRIMVLDKIAADQGKRPYINFDLEQPESYWDDFIEDITAAWGWVLAFPVSAVATAAMALLVPPPLALLSGFGLMTSLSGFMLYLYLGRYRYPLRFRASSLKFCLGDQKASPVRGTPVEVEGRVIGRGNPGLFFCEDIKVDDGTALMLVDYHQVLRLLDLFEGIFRTEDHIGKKVRIRGWYRRMIVPYIELYELEYDGVRKKMRTRGVFRGLTLSLGIIGLLPMIAMPASFIVLAGTLLAYLAFLKAMEGKQIKDLEGRMLTGPHPYGHIGSITGAVLRYRLIEFCEEVPGDVLPDDTFDGEEAYVRMRVECPRCGKRQDALIDGFDRPHVCLDCGLSAQVDIPRIRM